MSAGLDEDDTVGALTLFRRSLSVADDPNRDPRWRLPPLAGVGERCRDTAHL